jgi:alpha-glucosidase
MSSQAWWRDAAIYQIYPRSFKDTNGDGEGDLAGVVQELPYLKNLGIDAIWLSPFYRSPNRDGGYDVADPREVDPRFGTLANAEELISAAHQFGIRIIFDIVPNHFSSDHIWFQAAVRSAPGSSERARFHFYDGRGVDGDEPPNNWNSIFGGPAWSRVTETDGKLGQWYLHLFDSSQPDLNWNNPEIATDFETTLRFWLDRGVDGFRIDVAHGLVKDEIDVDHRDPAGLTKALRFDAVFEDKAERMSLLEDIPFLDREGVHEVYRSWRKLFDSYDGERMMVAEAFVNPSSRIALYVRPDELHQAFNFDFMLTDWDAELMRASITRTGSELATVGAPATWVLNNHDSSRVVSRVGSPEKARALSMIIHALPGGIYIYQGEELGLTDVPLPDEARQDPVFFRTNGADSGRDGCRVPLPWIAESPNFGFSSGAPWLPQPSSWKTQAVDVESLDPNSFLNFYRQSLALRKNHLALGGTAEIQWLPSANGILHFKRAPGFTLISNTTEQLVQVPTSATKILHQSQSGVSLLNQVVKLPANTTVWLED